VNEVDTRAHGPLTAEQPKRLHAALRLVLTVAGSFAVAVLLYRLSLYIRGPDYAHGRPWVASSKGYDCRPELKLCGDTKTAIFFHTELQDNPWLEIDLGEPISISHVIVKNRSDCCPDRAVPLMIEVAVEKDHFTEVARREQNFDLWDARFKPHTARYLRLSVPRRTFLHLEQVEVRR
jgi:hypothetical protein